MSILHGDTHLPSFLITYCPIKHSIFVMILGSILFMVNFHGEGIFSDPHLETS